uniref:C-type lectin domain-containing protein n=1 Tax=Astyanax mexicanus TaxID=7994 RepID=A0A8B9KM18_ASTMX
MKKAALNVLLITALYGLASSLVREHIHVDKIMTWTKAQQYCRLEYYDLSTISDSAEIKQIVDTGTPPCPSNSGYYVWCLLDKWIGQYTDTPNLPVPVWKWSTGENEALCPWASGEPSSVQNKTCVVTFSKTGVCFNLPCSYNFSFYCMNVYEVVLVQQKKTWQNALDYCRQHYTDLVSLKADNWMKEAVKVTKAAQTAHVWTGLRFLSGQWFWAKGDDLVYQAWSTEGQLQCPATNHRCGALGQSEETWQPRDCEEELNFLCFRKLHQTSASATHINEP